MYQQQACSFTCTDPLLTVLPCATGKDAPSRYLNRFKKLIHPLEYTIPSNVRM